MSFALLPPIELYLPPTLGVEGPDAAEELKPRRPERLLPTFEIPLLKLLRVEGPEADILYLEPRYYCLLQFNHSFKIVDARKMDEKIAGRPEWLSGKSLDIRVKSLAVFSNPRPF